MVLDINQAFTNGSVSQFAGASGLLQTLLNFIVGTEVTGATLSGSGVGPYTATLTTPVGLGRTVVDFTISSVAYSVQDDGSGNLSGTHVSSGSVNHSTGALTITLDTTPDAAPTADYLYGNPGQDWRLLVDRNSKDDDKVSPSEPFGSSCKEVILHNTGLNGADNVLIGIREWQYTPTAYYGWDLNGYLEYTTDMPWNQNDSVVFPGSDFSYNSTYEHYTKLPILPLIDGTMYYWFYSNRQRIVIDVKITSNYECLYAGFGRRFAAPSEYPYPLLVKGSAYGTMKVTDTGASHAFLIDRQSITPYWLLVDPQNTYVQIWGSSFYPSMLPYDERTIVSDIVKSGPGNHVAMFPVWVAERTNRLIYFDLDGVQWPLSNDLQSEDIVVGDDGIKYDVFQNVFRSDQDDYMAIAREGASTTTTTTVAVSTTTTTSTTV